MEQYGDQFCFISGIHIHACKCTRAHVRTHDKSGESKIFTFFTVFGMEYCDLCIIKWCQHRVENGVKLIITYLTSCKN